MAYYKEVQCTVVSETNRSDSGGTWVEYGGMRSDMKKKGMVLFLTGLLGMSLFLGGCTSKSEKKALEYKQLGIRKKLNMRMRSAVFRRLWISLWEGSVHRNWMCATTRHWHSTNPEILRQPSRLMTNWWIMIRKTGKYTISEEVYCWQTDSRMPA